MIKAIRLAVQEAQRILELRGIKDTFTVKVKDLKQTNWLGMYRSHSQFCSARPIIWINRQLPALCATRGVPPTHLGAVLLETILHEYGHIVWEFARIRQGPLWEKLRAASTSTPEHDEEQFAEGFGCALANGGTNYYDCLAEEYAKALEHDHVDAPLL